jgi:hypothetical protein
LKGVTVKQVFPRESEQFVKKHEYEITSHVIPDGMHKHNHDLVINRIGEIFITSLISNTKS